jgi:hypothetical protein
MHYHIKYIKNYRTIYHIFRKKMYYFIILMSIIVINMTNATQHSEKIVFNNIS